MKTAPLFSLLLLLTFLCFYTHSSAADDQKLPPVLDIDGKQLRAGIKYYILPVFRGRGGGLTLASTGNETCPLGVVQDPLEVRPGLPLTFSPVNPKENVIRVSTDQNIKFSAVTVCAQSTVWKLGGFDEATRKNFVSSGGVEGNPGPGTISNWFKIDKYGERDYKLVFCPTVCNFCKVICRDVGIFIQGKQRRLAVSLADDIASFGVIFKKASSS